MKKILSNVYILAALFMISAAITSCSKSDDTPTPEPKPVGPTTYTMTIKATKAADAKTRALSFDGDGKLNATWAEGEKVTVFNVTRSANLGGYLEAQGDGASTTLTGTLTGTVEKNDVLTLKFCSPSYSSQGGTLEYIAANCDYATANVTVANSANGKITTTTDADFKNQQAIVKFTLTDKSSTAIKAKPLVVNDGTNTYTVIPSTATDEIYVAIPGISGGTITLSAQSGVEAYTYKKTGVTFTNGSYYAINVKMELDALKTPLTIENCSGSGTYVTVSYFASGNLYYNTDKGINAGSDWVTATGDAVTINFEDVQNGVKKVYFRGDESTKNTDYTTKIICNNDCYIYGNIMSLLDPTNFATKTDLPYDDTFKELFKDNANITHRNGYDLVLPATTLRTQCYSSMFSGCTKLNHIKCLATQGLNAPLCTSNWLSDTARPGTFVIVNGTQSAWADKGYDDGIPYGWTVETVTTE